MTKKEKCWWCNGKKVITHHYESEYGYPEYMITNKCHICDGTGKVNHEVKSCQWQ
jgi:DnaJ-class molecular chaperone